MSRLATRRAPARLAAPLTGAGRNVEVVTGQLVTVPAVRSAPRGSEWRYARPLSVARLSVAQAGAAPSRTLPREGQVVSGVGMPLGAVRLLNLPVAPLPVAGAGRQDALAAGLIRGRQVTGLAPALTSILPEVVARQLVTSNAMRLGSVAAGRCVPRGLAVLTWGLGSQVRRIHAATVHAAWTALAALAAVVALVIDLLMTWFTLGDQWAVDELVGRTVSGDGAPAPGLGANAVGLAVAMDVDRSGPVPAAVGALADPGHEAWWQLRHEDIMPAHEGGVK